MDEDETIILHGKPCFVTPTHVCIGFSDENKRQEKIKKGFDVQDKRFVVVQG